MDSTYDIFRRVQPNQAPIWLESVKGLVEANTRLSELRSKSQDEFLLWNAATGKFVDLD